MNLDQRARRATNGLKSSISGHPLLMMNPAPVKKPLSLRLLSFAGAFALVMLVGFMMVQTNMFASDGDEASDTTVPPSTPVTSTTVVSATTVPTPPAEVEVPSVSSDDDDGVEPAGDTPVTEPADITPPVLVITYPSDGEHIKETAVAFSGTTEPGAVVTAGPYEADVAADGSWSIVLILGEGGNKALFSAVDAAGNVSESSIVVYYDPPITTTTTTKPESEWAFTAHATFGECELSPPYDEYYGTAAPGTTILVLSDYGSGSTVTNADGTWSIRVEFPTAPYGKGFVVKVKNETTYEKLPFEFVSWAG